MVELFQCIFWCFASLFSIVSTVLVILIYRSLPLKAMKDFDYQEEQNKLNQLGGD